MKKSCKGADVDLILSDGDALEELLFDLPSEPEHLPNIVSDLIERRDNLLFGPDRSNEETDHGLEIHGERRHRSREPFTKGLRPASVIEYTLRARPDVLLLPVEQAHGREALHLSVDGAFGSEPHVSGSGPAAAPLVWGPGCTATWASTAYEVVVSRSANVFLLTYSKREYSFTQFRV